MTTTNISAPTTVTTGDLVTAAQLSARHQGGFRGYILYDTNSTFSKGDFSWLRGVVARCQGGGGAGGGSEATVAGEASAGQGGSGGAYAESWIDVATLGSSETVTVGTGGAGSSGSSGADGGTSSFGAHVSANGGNGGGVLVAAASFNYAAGSNPETTATGDLVIPGSPGAGAVRDGGSNTCQGGQGGHSALGVGGKEPGNGSAGNTGSGYGGGGSGACTRASGSAFAGGAGADGAVIVELYA